MLIYVGQRGAGAAHLSAGAQGAGGLCTGASGSFHPATNMSQPSPFTTKLQVTSGHLEPKINSSPRFKIEIKLDLRTKMYVLCVQQYAAGFDARSPSPSFFKTPAKMHQRKYTFLF